METLDLPRASSPAERFLLSAYPQVSTPHDGHISPFSPEGVDVGDPGSVGEPYRPMVPVDPTHGALRAGRTSLQRMNHG